MARSMRFVEPSGTVFDFTITDDKIDQYRENFVLKEKNIEIDGLYNFTGRQITKTFELGFSMLNETDIGNLRNLEYYQVNFFPDYSNSPALFYLCQIDGQMNFSAEFYNTENKHTGDLTLRKSS